MRTTSGAAFTRGDDSYSAQFWFARHAHECEAEARRRESREVFRHLREAPIDHATRIRIRDVARIDGKQRQYTGAVLRLETSHGFIVMDGTGNHVFFHRSDSPANHWSELAAEKRVTFGIGYTMGGPKGIDVSASSLASKLG